MFQGVLRLHEIDNSSLIIPLLSPAYLASSHHVEEFHTALCRHRFSEDLLLFPLIVEPLAMRPVYPHLVFTMFSTNGKYSGWISPFPLVGGFTRKK